MCNQLTELLTQYGPICELWLDGGWDRKPEDWDLPRVYDLVKKLQPQCAIGVNHTIVLKENEREFALPDSMIVDSISQQTSACGIRRWRINWIKNNIYMMVNPITCLLNIQYVLVNRGLGLLKESHSQHVIWMNWKNCSIGVQIIIIHW